MPDIRLILSAVVLAIFIGVGFYVKSLNDQVVTCKANTKIQQSKYDRDIKAYENNIADIIKFYDSEIEAVDSFRKVSNETDCQATKRFFNRTNY